MDPRANSFRRTINESPKLPVRLLGWHKAGSYKISKSTSLYRLVRVADPVPAPLHRYSAQCSP